MPVLELMASSGLGSLLGMRHALEPDHLAAVSTLVTGERSSYKAAFLGVCWGLGHTFALIAVGTVLRPAARARCRRRWRTTFEFGVAVMLVGLGLRAIFLAARQGTAGPAHVHHHGSRVHVHEGTPAHVHIGAWTLARRPLVVGAVHGLAGSGALDGARARRRCRRRRRGSPTWRSSGWDRRSGWRRCRVCSAGRSRGLAVHARVTRRMSLAVGCLSTALGIFYGSRILGF